MGFSARSTEKTGNPDDFGALVGSLAGIVAMTDTLGVVAERTGCYIGPRMCGGFLELRNPKNTLTAGIHPFTARKIPRTNPCEIPRCYPWIRNGLE